MMSTDCAYMGFSRQRGGRSRRQEQTAGAGADSRSRGQTAGAGADSRSRGRQQEQEAGGRRQE